MTRRCFLIGAMIMLLSGGAAAQTGGQFSLEQSAVAAGGGRQTGGQFTVDGTTGQAVAGQQTAIAPFSMHAGFWNQAAFAPTAAEVTVSGRVTTADGRRGIRNVRVTMTGTNGETRSTLSGVSGVFRFTDVPAGETYIFSASAKRYIFGEPTQVRTITEDTDNIVFVAVGEGLISN
jgi:hypothetical protein